MLTGRLKDGVLRDYATDIRHVIPYYLRNCFNKSDFLKIFIKKESFLLIFS